MKKTVSTVGVRGKEVTKKERDARALGYRREACQDAGDLAAAARVIITQNSLIAGAVLVNSAASRVCAKIEELAEEIAAAGRKLQRLITEEIRKIEARTKAAA